LRDGRWVIPHLVGKGKRVRLVPVPGRVKERLDEWTTKGEIRERRIFRSMRKNGMVSGESLSAAAVWKIVLYYARRTAGIRELSPRDLRSYAVGRIMPNRPRYACWIADSTALRLSIVINKVFNLVMPDLQYKGGKDVMYRRRPGRGRRFVLFEESASPFCDHQRAVVLGFKIAAEIFNGCQRCLHRVGQA
jgi:hypothetical protein